MNEVECLLLRHLWFPVARVADVAQGPVAARILDTELVVYLAGGRSRVASARCPHRGMAMWLGKVRDGLLECPYHGWLFESGTGACVRVPSLPPGGAVPRAALPVYPAREAYGHVWSCLADPYLELPELPGYGGNGWQYGFGVPTDLSCGLRSITENFRDMAHFPFVHAESMGPRVRHEVDAYEVRRSGWTLDWVLSTDLGGTALSGNQALASRQTLTYTVTLPMTACVNTSFPGGERRMVAQFVTPIAADGSRVRHFWVVGIDDSVGAGHGISIDEMWDYERQIFEEDFPIVENQWPSEAPLDLHSQVHTRADRFSIVYRRTYSDLLDAFAAAAMISAGDRDGGFGGRQEGDAHRS